MQNDAISSWQLAPNLPAWNCRRNRAGGGSQSRYHGQRAASKLNCPTLLGLELTKQSWSRRPPQLQPAEKSSDHPAWGGDLTSPHNSNQSCGQKA
jgi:hypothetical protein